MTVTDTAQIKQRSRVLLFAVVTTALSLIPTAYVAILANSVTLYADLFRCLGEFIAIFLSWLVFRKISSTQKSVYGYGFGKLEQFATMGVGLAMLMTFAVSLMVAVYRFITPVVVDNILPGIIFTILSILGNSFIWLRSRRIDSESPSPLIESQARLFRAKTFISGVVLIALLLSQLSSFNYIFIYSDPFGSIIIAGFLFYSAIMILSASMNDLLDKSLDEVVQFNVLKALLLHEKEYAGFHGLRSRRSGRQVYIDINLEFSDAKKMAEIRQAIKNIKKDILKVIPEADVSIIVA